LLDKLATTKPEIIPNITTSLSPQAKPVESVKKDILSQLISKEKTTNGSTTPTGNKAAGE
jgi:hypothetical protein